MRARSILVAIVATVAIGCGSGTPAPTGPGGTSSTPTNGATAAASIPVDGPTVPAATEDQGQELPDPCALITKDEAGVAVTKPVGDGVHELVSTPALGSGRNCRFMVLEGRNGEAAIGTFRNPGDLYETYKLQQSQFGNVSDLAGVGDKAFTVGNGECDVVKGDVLMVLTLAPGDGYETDPEPRMIVLCQQAAARL